MLWTALGLVNCSFLHYPASSLLVHFGGSVHRFLCILAPCFVGWCSVVFEGQAQAGVVPNQGSAVSSSVLLKHWKLMWKCICVRGLVQSLEVGYLTVVLAPGGVISQSKAHLASQTAWGTVVFPVLFVGSGDQEVWMQVRWSTQKLFQNVFTISARWCFQNFTQEYVCDFYARSKQCGTVQLLCVCAVCFPGPQCDTTSLLSADFGEN